MSKGTVETPRPRSGAERRHRPGRSVPGMRPAAREAPKGFSARRPVPCPTGDRCPSRPPGRVPPWPADLQRRQGGVGRVRRSRGTGARLSASPWGDRRAAERVAAQRRGARPSAAPLRPAAPLPSDQASGEGSSRQRLGGGDAHPVPPINRSLPGPTQEAGRASRRWAGLGALDGRGPR